MSPQPKQGRGSPANQQKLEEGRRESSLQVSEGAGPCQHLDFGSSQPPGLRQCDFIVLSHPGHGASLQQPQETNSVTIPDHGETPEREIWRFSECPFTYQAKDVIRIRISQKIRRKGAYNIQRTQNSVYFLQTGKPPDFLAIG